MLLSDVFDSLAYGPLAAVAMATDGEISTQDMPRLLNLINQGLLDLHKRFELQRKTQPLEVVEGDVRYVLRGEGDDLLELLEILVENFHGISPVTRVNHPKYLRPDVPLCYMMVSPTTVRFNHPLNNLMDFSISYKARHPKIVVDDFETVDTTKVEIDLPMAYLEALSFYVASKVIVPIDNNLGNPQEGSNYRAMYEQACQALEFQGLDIDDAAHSDHRFNVNGFV